MTAAATTGETTDAVAMTAAMTDMDTAAMTTDATPVVGAMTGTAGGADGRMTGLADVSLRRMTVSSLLLSSA